MCSLLSARISHLKARHRDRSAFLAGESDPLQATVTERLLDRLEDCKRSFPAAAVLGGAGELADAGCQHGGQLVAAKHHLHLTA